MVDFSVGYSSLNYLPRLPADNIKIDRSFVSEIFQDSTSKKLLSSLINLLMNIGKTVTAEGIEIVEQLEWLKAHGCHVGQGYYSSKPITIDDAITLIHRSKDNVSYTAFKQ
jgi:EAL domain-containing protein (putative c-di-GMP-specific phosphodiesterase class I)